MARPTISSLALRAFAGGVTLGLAALAGGSYLASAQSISGHNSDAPVSYAADRIELQDRQNRVVLSGNVDITQAGLNLRAARTTPSSFGACEAAEKPLASKGGSDTCFCNYICLNKCENGRLTVRFSLRPFTFTVACPRKSRDTASMAPALTMVER